MPCCAFAAVLVGQILLALGAFRNFILGRAPAGPGANPAVLWRPGAAPERPEPRRRLRRAGPALELAIVSGAI